MKVSATYMDGFKATGVCIVAGGDAVGKGRKTAEAILKRFCVHVHELSA